jgi:hypothetical protein
MIDSFSQEETLLLNGQLDRSSYYFFPARLTQANELSPSRFEALRALYESRFMKALPSLANGPMWLDLSQFVFSPHFVDLFRQSAVEARLMRDRCESQANG